MNTSHTIRAVTSLNGLWDFAFLGAVDGEALTPAELASRTFEKVPVPSAFDALPPHAGRRGAAVYRRRFQVRPGWRARIEFGAVSLWSRIWVDGEQPVENACGYAPFQSTCRLLRTSSAS